LNNLPSNACHSGCLAARSSNVQAKATFAGWSWRCWTMASFFGKLRGYQDQKLPHKLSDSQARFINVSVYGVF